VDDRPTTSKNRANLSSSVVSRRSSSALYCQRPTWLDMAHAKLDRVVLDAYGWPHDIADEELLARLLALNLAWAADAAARRARLPRF
jgi:hypothetical protein